MTKTQLRKAINKDVYEYINKYYPEFDIDHNEGGGRVYFIDTTSPFPYNDSIEYHQSAHTLCTLNLASERVKDVERELESWINALIKQYQYV
jgi:hypothetical protein